MKLIDKVKRFWHEAKTKVTTYVGLATAAVAELAAHAEELLNQLPSLAQFLPKAAIVASTLTQVAAGLGLLTVWTRVRRLLKAPPPAGS